MLIPNPAIYLPQESAEDPTQRPATDTLLKATLTAAHATILDGDLTMAGQLVDAALGHIERADQAG